MTTGAPSEVTSGRIYAIQYVRGFAALLVVLYHAAGVIGSPQYQNNKTFVEAFDGIDRAVDLFFVLSGFVLALSVFRRGDDEHPGRFLINRVLRIWPMGAVAAVLYFVLQGAVGTYNFQGDFSRFVASFFLVPFEGPSIPVVLWSLKQELIFYIVFSAVYVHRRGGLALVALWSVSSLFISGDSAMVSAVFHSQNIQFLLGMIACAIAHQWKPSAAVANVAFPLTIVVFMVVALVPGRQGNQQVVPAIVYGVLGAAIMYAGYFTAYRPIAWLKFLGDITFSLYLIHHLVLSGMIRVLLRSPVDLPDAVILVVLFVGGVMSGLLLYPVERRFESLRKTYASGRSAPEVTPAGVVSARQTPRQ